MLNFSESFVGGFFGFRRTYGAVARFECQAASELDSSWPAALEKIAEWRSQRGSRATVLHIYIHIDPKPENIWRAIDWVKAHVLVPPADQAPQLRGLHQEIAVFSPDLDQYIDLVIYSSGE